MEQNKKPVLREYFLLLLPAFFVLHGYTENFPLIKAGDAFFLFLQYSALSLLLYPVSFLVFRSWRKAAVAVLLLLSFYFFFGSMHDAAKSVLPGTFVVKYTFLLPFTAAVAMAAIIFLKKTKRQFNRFVRYANVLLVVLLAVDIFSLSKKFSEQPETTAVAPAGFSHCDSCPVPDIYFIIADEYAGNRELKEIFNFDNSSFEKALESKGFKIVDNSISNYNYTPHSMASLFSMNYLRGIEGKNKSKKDRHIAYALINKNPVIEFLRSQGYRFKNFSVFQFDDELPSTHSSFILTGKELLTSQTFFSRIDRDIRFNLITTYQLRSQMIAFANNEINSLNNLLEATKKEAARTSNEPRFIYTHLMMPHYPYFFDKNGQRMPPEMVIEGHQVKQKAYIEYLQYCNGRFLELIDYILTHSKKPPVIFFMGDHGFRHFTTDVDHKYYFMNLNAVYLPNKNYASFYNGMSAVNEFRILFNSQFRQNLPLLKDSTVYLTE